MIVCRVDRAPVGSAVRRVYARNGIRLSYGHASGDTSWEMSRVALPNLREEDLLDIPSHCKWVEAMPGINLLHGRRTLWGLLKAKFGAEEAARITAETFLLNSADDLGRLAQLDPDVPLVLKSSRQRRKGIRLGTPAEALKLQDQYLVAERFIGDQLRFRNTTFHLRCYLLLTLSEGALAAWMFEDAICGWAISAEDAANPFEEWITHPDNEIADDYPCCLSELCGELGLDFEDVWWRIAERLADVIPCCSAPVMELADRTRAFHFQHFGFDVVLESDGSPRILEVNAGPEMDARNPRYAAIKDQVLRDGLAVAGIVPAESHGFVKVLELNS